MLRVHLNMQYMTKPWRLPSLHTLKPIKSKPLETFLLLPQSPAKIVQASPKLRYYHQQKGGGGAVCVQNAQLTQKAGNCAFSKVNEKTLHVFDRL